MRNTAKTWRFKQLKFWCREGGVTALHTGWLCGLLAHGIGAPLLEGGKNKEVKEKHRGSELPPLILSHFSPHS